MRQANVLCILVSLLGPVAGCQLVPRDNLASTSGPSDSAHAQTELPAKATAELCIATADSFARGGKDAEAIALLEKARQNGANKQQVGRRLAMLYDQQKDFNRAMEEYKQLLQRSPRDADLLNDVGYCYYNQGNWAEAERYLRQALAVHANHARAWNNLGMTLAQANRPDESLEAFGRVVSPAQAMCNMAFILQTQGKFEDARASYRQALAQEPDLSLARAALAKLDKMGMSSPPAPAPARGLDAMDRERVEMQRPIEVSLP